MKNVLIAIALLALTGCSSTIVRIDINAEGSARINSDLSIPTTQDTSGDGLLDKLTPDIGLPSFGSGAKIAPVEEEIAEPEALEDGVNVSPTGDVEVID